MGHEARGRVRREVMADPGPLVEALVGAVRSQVPAYRALDGSRLPEVRAIAAWVLARSLELWVDGGCFTTADLARFRGIGAARAADGRPLPAVLRAYRVAATALLEHLSARTAGLLEPDDVFALARLWLTALDSLSESLYAGYTAAAERLSGDRNRALRDLLDDLVTGRHASAGAVADRTARLGVRLPDPYRLLVAEPDPGGPDPGGSRTGGPGPVRGAVAPEAAAAAAAAALADAITVAPAEAPAAGQTPDACSVLVTARGPRAVLLLPAEAAGALPDALAALHWRGCAVTGEPAEGIPAAYRLAADALDTAPAHAYGATPLLGDADAHVLALLAARPGAAPDRVARAVLGPLLRPDRRHLAEALDAYLDTGSATAAAEALHLHPQTLRYRLRRIRELTGRDPRRPWHRLTFDIARNLAGRPPG
ncbi:helix-turn-helix domain-containing protein [Streptacidiphilus sp. ASG 303]|uniref:PucR family transcriptional regulator n=1 Tax=Streptacidiphilus sp. ASG 303 TaxID=2896847 RepID=UPI001E4DBAB3|nr:helix-turn-helix domain-containing protein [Streptacidiphilus sp. ASG 303]MCD0484377.1 helix-turn-helix domain-containing protein [Streptacidiphilus sp. ASG 303]